MKELSIAEKQLLLVDLCARLPYGVKVQVADYKTPIELSHINTKNGNGRKPYCFVFAFEPERVKPYLRPMSSMTEEEMKEYHSLIEEQKNIPYFTFCSCVTRYLDSIHVDHRAIKDKDGKWKTMIQLGLALEAPEGMYNIKEK